MIAEPITFSSILVGNDLASTAHYRHFIFYLIPQRGGKSKNGVIRRVSMSGQNRLEVKGIALCTHALVTPKDFTFAHQNLPLCMEPRLYDI